MQVGRNWVIYLGLKSDPKTPRSQGSPRGARKALFLQDREDLAAQAARTRTRTFTSTPETFQYTSQKARGGQTSIKCVFTPGKLRLLPTTSLPPSLPPKITQVMSSNTPCPHPTRNNFHTFFFLNAKNPLKMQISPKETQATYKNRRHDSLEVLYVYKQACIQTTTPILTKAASLTSI